MNEAFVEINGVRTKVVTWGRWIEETQGNTNDIIIIIPGNPGITGFYKEFAKALYEKTEIPVWCIGHAGHNFANKSITKLPKFEKHKDVYGLKAQIEHKIEFFRSYVPNDARVHLVAHSIGSYMTVEILNHAEVQAKIKKAYLLFPTIEHMAETKNGKFLNTVVKPLVWLILLLVWIFTKLPNFFATWLLYVYMFIADIPRDLHVQNFKDLLLPGVLKRVFFLAFEEMDQVKQRNDIAILNNFKKIKLYYGRTDGWAPEKFCKHIKNDLSSVDAELTDINHTFVFNHSVDVACTVAGWIKATK